MKIHRGNAVLQHHLEYIDTWSYLMDFQILNMYSKKRSKSTLNLENVTICHDDMIVSGATYEEHDNAVTERARQVNAKFNKEKFQFRQKQVKFMRQIFHKGGMQIDPDRLDSLNKLDIPKSRIELQRIIGFFNYVRRYVPNMSEYMNPL